MQLAHEAGSGDGSSGGRVDPSKIEVIVGNPDNIVSGGGVMKPLIAVAILSSEGSPIHLVAATNKVKGIYDHYGFRVVASYPARHIERPERHIKAPSVDYPHGYYGGEVLGPLVPERRLGTSKARWSSPQKQPSNSRRSIRWRMSWMRRASNRSAQD